MKSGLINSLLFIVVTILSFSAAAQAYSLVQVNLPISYGKHGDAITIPVLVSDLTGKGVFSAQMILTFDSNVVAADSAYITGTVAQGCLFEFNDAISGHMRIAMSKGNPLSGSGVLVYIRFIVKGSEGDTTTLHFNEFLFNEGDPLDSTTDGLFEVTAESDVKDENESCNFLSKLTLFQNYPNPLNPETDISYALPTECNVKLIIYNVAGQNVRTLVDEHQITGFKTIHWNGKDNEGKEVASGVYFYKIQAGAFTEARKMILMK